MPITLITLIKDMGRKPTNHKDNFRNIGSLSINSQGRNSGMLASHSLNLRLLKGALSYSIKCGPKKMYSLYQTLKLKVSNFADFH